MTFMSTARPFNEPSVVTHAILELARTTPLTTAQAARIIYAMLSEQ